MSDVLTRTEGRAGWITLNRPDALNAATEAMLRDIEAAIDTWRGNDAVEIVLIDAAGDRAFCAGGDIADLYAAGRAGDFAFGRRFWRDEYRLNAKLATYPKPIVSFLQGFTMGGGVGLGCHASHRIVGASSQIAMPECGIGLVPDVGGSMLLARASGRLGEYLGLTGARMGPGDAIRAGFADHYLDEAHWPDLKSDLCHGEDVQALAAKAGTALDDPLNAWQSDIDHCFSAPTLPALVENLRALETDFAKQALKAVLRNSPLSMAAALVLIRRVRQDPTIHNALTQEYRYTWRASEDGDFLEGIRAAIIDKDRNPCWKHAPDSVTEAEAMKMLAPLGDHDLIWEDLP